MFGIECIVEAINVSWLIIEDLRDKYSEGDTIIVTVTNVIYPEDVIDKNSPEYEFIKCSQKNYNEGDLPTEQTLKDFLESKKGNAY